MYTLEFPDHQNSQTMYFTRQLQVTNVIFIPLFWDLVNSVSPVHKVLSWFLRTRSSFVDFAYCEITSCWNVSTPIAVSLWGLSGCAKEPSSPSSCAIPEPLKKQQPALIKDLSGSWVGHRWDCGQPGTCLKGFKEFKEKNHYSQPNNCRSS